MSAAKKLEMTPDEQFLQGAMRDGRCKRMDVSMKALGTPDVSLQARVQHLDMDHVLRLARTKEAQGSLSPVVVFTDNHVYLLGDGHHRHEVYRKANAAAIPAYVVECSPSTVRREALEYATMTNREMCLGRKPEDITKAVEMILQDDAWWKRADGWIADHVGCSGPTVKRIRSRMVRPDRPAPEKVDCRDGFSTFYRREDFAKKGKPSRVYKSTRGYFNARVDNKLLHGKTPEILQDKVELYREQLVQRRYSLTYQSIDKLLNDNGFSNMSTRGKAKVIPGLYGWHRPGFIAVGCDFSYPESLVAACGRLDLGREKVDDSAARRIVLSYVEDGPPAMIELGRKAGFEFMTPEEFVESLKGEAK